MRSRSASAENSQVLSTKVREELSESCGCKIATFKCKSCAKCVPMAPAKVVRKVHSRSSSSSCKCFRAKVACEARSRSSSSNIATSIFARECNVRKVRSRISSWKIATCRRKSSAPFLRSQTVRRHGQERLTRERHMKGWVREVAQHHAREGPSRVASRAASCTASGAALCATSCLRSIMRNITRSFTRSSVKTQRSAQEKLTGEICSKRGAKLAHQKLRRDIDVFTHVFSPAVGEVSEFII